MSGDVKYQFGFSKYNNSIDIIGAINDLHQITTQGTALSLALQTLFNQTYINGLYRSTAQSFVVALVDEMPTESSSVQQQV